MPELIRGEDLTEEQKQAVREGFPFRWTVENQTRAMRLYAPHGGPPAFDPETDDEWFRNHAFKFNKNGQLTARASAVWIGGAGKPTWMPAP